MGTAFTVSRAGELPGDGGADDVYAIRPKDFNLVHGVDSISGIGSFGSGAKKGVEICETEKNEKQKTIRLITSIIFCTQKGHR